MPRRRRPAYLARRAVLRLAGTAAVRLPRLARLDNWLVTAGLIDQAGLRLRLERDPAGALALLDVVLAHRSAPSSTWRVVAAAHEAAGDLPAALSAARSWTSSPKATADAFLLERRLAEAAGRPAEADEALRRLAVRAPASNREASATMRELARSGRHLVETFADTAAHTRLADRNWVAQLRAESRLTRIGTADPAALAAEVDRVRAEVRDGDRIVLRTLAELDDHAGAAALAPRVADRDVPSRALRDASRRALRAGRASSAAVLARRVLDVQPRTSVATKVLEEAEDQLRGAAYGFDVGEPAAAPAYRPGEHRVLAVLAQSLPIQSGGYATRSHGILTSMRDRGWEPRAVTRLGFPYDRWPTADHRVVPELDVVDGIEYHRLLGPPDERVYPQFPLTSYVGRMADRLVRHATEHRAALLHASSFHINGLAASMAARRLGLPHVYEMRGLEDLMKVSRDPGFVDSDRYRFTTRLELQNCLDADRVFVITEALRTEMAARGVPPEKMVVLPNGVHVDAFSPRDRDRELEAQLGYQGKTVVGYVGGIVDYEGLDLLLEAMAVLRDQRDDVRLLVVGDGHYDRVVREVAERLRLGDVVTFTGRVPHAEVSRYLSLVDITPFPRRPLPVCELISPIKPFEAMAMGKAAVVSSVAALTEIVRDEDTGLVFAKGDAADLARVLTRLLDDPALRRRLGDSARAWVRAERDWSSVVAAADDAYRELLQSRRPEVALP